MRQQTPKNGGEWNTDLCDERCNKHEEDVVDKKDRQ